MTDRQTDASDLIICPMLCYSNGTDNDIYMLKMSTIGRNARFQTFAKVVDSFVDRCLWQVMPDLLLL